MKAESLKSTYTLSDGNRIPCIGFGTWQTPDGDVAYASVLAALRNGYRHIDTATAYGNAIPMRTTSKQNLTHL